jgi:hypothetical protein
MAIFSTSTRNWQRVSAMMIGGCLLIACVPPSAPGNSESDNEPTKPQLAPTSEPAPTNTPAPANTPAPTSEHAPTSDRAYVSVDGVGLHVLDERGWRLLLDTRAPIRDMLLHDGRLFVLSAFGVQRVGADGQPETIAAITRETATQMGDAVALASADGREFWVAGSLGVARYGSSWEFTPVATAEPTNIDLALDRAGRPWLAFGSLFRYHDASWQPLADPPNTQPIALLPDPRSEAMLVHAGCHADLHACVLLRATADAPVTRIEAPATDGCNEYDRMAVSPDGRKAAIAGRCGLVRLTLDGEANPVRLGLDDGWPGQPLRSLALDAGGRVWAGTNNGLMIIAADGRIDDYPIAQLGESAGPVGPILIEHGSPPPPTLGRVRNGGLTGVIVVLDGETKRPLPGVRIELCNRLAPGGELEPDPQHSPCAGIESTHTTTTDGDGRFTLEGLPIDHYYFGVELDGRWARGQPKALNMRAGMSGNVGKVTVAIPD